MKNKAPLSGWRRIGVTGRGRARKGVALPWPPAGLQATPSTISRVGKRITRARPGRGYYGECAVQDREGGFKVKALLWAGRKDPPLPSREGRGGVGGQGMCTQIPAFFMWFPWAISQSQALD